MQYLFSNWWSLNCFSKLSDCFILIRKSNYTSVLYWRDPFRPVFFQKTCAQRIMRSTGWEDKHRATHHCEVRILTQWPFGNLAVIFKLWFSNIPYKIMDTLGHSLWNCCLVNGTKARQWKVNIGCQVMICCRQASRHYLSQCWFRSM